MATKGARVHIYGDWDGSAVKKATKDLSAFEKQTRGFSSGITKSFAGIGASIGGALAFGAVAAQMKRMAQAAAEDQRSAIALSQTLDNLGLSVARVGMEKFVSDTMMATGVADDQLRPSLSRLLRSVENVSEAQRAMGIALDISAATGKDVETVANALGKAYDGNAVALQRLGLGLDASLLKSKDMGKITDELSRKFSGQAAAAAASYSGQMARMDLAVSEAQETIGYALLDSLNRSTAAFGGTGGFTEVVGGAADEVANLVTGIGLAVSELSRLGSVELGGDASFGIFDLIRLGYENTPGLGLLITTTKGLIGAGDAARTAQEELNAEVDKSITLRRAYAGQLNAAAVAEARAGDEADRAKAKVDALNKALAGLSAFGNRQQGRINLRRMRAEGPDAGQDKRLSGDEARQFGIDYAGQALSVAQSYFDQGQWRRGRRVMSQARQYLRSEIGDDLPNAGRFIGGLLATPQQVNQNIATADAARERNASTRGAEGWRATMSSVFGGNVTINITAETPAQALQQAKNWARLAAAGRGGPVVPIGPTVNPIVMPGANIR